MNCLSDLSWFNPLTSTLNSLDCGTEFGIKSCVCATVHHKAEIKPHGHLERCDCGQIWGCPGDGRWSRPGNLWAGSPAGASCGNPPSTGEPLAGGSRSWRSGRASGPAPYRTPQWTAWRAATEPEPASGCSRLKARPTNTYGPTSVWLHVHLSFYWWTCFWVTCCM